MSAAAAPGAGENRLRVPTSVQAPVRLTSKQLLAHAYGLLDDPPPVFASRWPRAVALLARQALETSLAELWAKRAVKIGWARERSQLICLPAVIGDRGLAADATLAWNGLSGACHQHPYNLPPTVGELAGWLETVDRLRRAVDAVPGPAVSE
jgi:hypothetical protein